MKIATGASANSEEQAAVREALAGMMKELGEAPKLVVVFSTGRKYNGKKIFEALKSGLPQDVKIWGLNSDSAGVMVPGGIQEGIAVMGFAAPDLTVGVASVPLDWKNAADYQNVGKQVAEAALRDAGKKPGDPPKVIFFGGLNLVTDIDIFQGVRDVIGEVPICGGNTGQQSAQDLVPGDGYVFSNSGSSENAVSIAALWMDSKVGVAYRYSYSEDPGKQGIVTKADTAKRIIYEIDHRPAAEVFNEWIGGKIADLLSKGGMIPLPIIGKYELKKPISEGSADYVAVAFLEVYPDKSVFVSHESVAEGTQLTLLELGSEQDVINNTAVVATVARNRGEIEKDDVAGALLVYCYALLYTAKGSGYDITPTFATLQRTLGGAPFAGFFSGGEIGYSPHFQDEGNRMMAVSNVIAVFGKH